MCSPAKPPVFVPNASITFDKIVLNNLKDSGTFKNVRGKTVLENGTNIKGEFVAKGYKTSEKITDCIVTTCGSTAENMIEKSVASAALVQHWLPNLLAI